MAGIAVLLAGCSTGRSDAPTLQGQPTVASTVPGNQPSGPAITMASVSGLPVPQLQGKSGINTALRQVVAGLRGTCRVTVERNDPRLVSVLWACQGRRPVTATYDQRTQRELALGDLLQGDYPSYLSATGDAQLQADGVATPDASDLSSWYVDADSLVVAFSQGTVSFPLSSLGGYLRPAGPLSA